MGSNPTLSVATDDALPQAEQLTLRLVAGIFRSGFVDGCGSHVLGHPLAYVLRQLVPRVAMRVLIDRIQLGEELLDLKKIM